MWTEKEFLDVFQAHLAPLLQSDDPHAAAAASQTCMAWHSAFKSSKHPCIKVNFWSHSEVSSLAMWLKGNLGGVSSLQLSTEDQEMCGEAEQKAIREIAASLPTR